MLVGVGTEHTCEHYREDYYPELTERTHYEDWESNGSTSLRDRAAAKVDAVLAKHRAVPLQESVVRQISQLI